MSKTQVKTIAYLLGTAELDGGEFHGICLHFAEEFSHDPEFGVAEFLAACLEARNNCHMSIEKLDGIQVTIALNTGTGGVA